MNINAGRVLQLLETARRDLSEAAMQRPAGRDAFEYGRVVGMYAGLSEAFEIVSNAMDEEPPEFL